MRALGMDILFVRGELPLPERDWRLTSVTGSEIPFSRGYPSPLQTAPYHAIAESSCVSL